MSIFQAPVMLNDVSSRTVSKNTNGSVIESVVISGIGGRFPESDSMDEFARNLFEKVTMLTEDDRRWPTELFEMNQRMGKLKSIDRFDGAFFGWRKFLADSLDPQGRILLETTYEAICDSGVNPQSLRGTQTGVYVGHSTFGMPDGLPALIDPTSRTSLLHGMAWLQGTSKAMYANRISYFFDFRGPSITLDTACSSSMVALDIAVDHIRSSKIDQAIVAGGNINMQAFTNYLYQKLGFNAPDGQSKVWDSKADGFVRSETVVCLFLQRQNVAKRIYARIIQTCTNMDGYKDTGMFFPSSNGQRELLMSTYKEANIDPNEITYIEAHGTGTKMGDFQEASAIHDAYCTTGRTKPLLIGLLKSNVGHAEAASGIASLTKVIIAFENECIPANQGFCEVKKEIRELKFLEPVEDNYPYTPGIAGVNSFGVGGVNGHALVEPNYKVADNTCNQKIATPHLPRLVPLHGRTKEAVEHLMNFIEANINKVTVHFLALIADVFKYKPMLCSAGFPYRGTLLITTEGDTPPNNLHFSRSKIEFINVQFCGQLCFFYSGIGGQSAAMAKEFTSLECFASKLHRLAPILTPYGLDLVALLTSDSAEMTIACSVTAKFVSTTAFQLIWTDILIDDLELTPETILGHSFGEISAAYAQGYITAEEALLVALHRGRALEESRKEIPLGLMAAVGLSATEATERLPENVFLACDNAPKLVTISGEQLAMKQFLEKLTAEGIFVRELDSAKYPLHTPFLEVAKSRLLTKLETLFASTRAKKSHPEAPTTSQQTLKWISTCQSVEFMADMHENHQKAHFYRQLSAYFVDNLLQPVNFTDALKRVVDQTIVLEIADRELFEKIITRSNASLKYQPLLRVESRTTVALLSTLSALYCSGFNISIERLYPPVQWPVPRGTPSIASLMRWDHQEAYFVKQYPDYYFPPTASDMNIELNPENPEFDYLYHHIIEGMPILPGTAYLFFAWKKLADSKGISWTKLPVQFENVQLKRAIYLDPNNITVVKVRLLEPLGEFIILEGTEVAAKGEIRELQSGSLDHQEMLKMFDHFAPDMITLSKEDFYKELRIRGYEFGPKMQSIVDYTTDIKRCAFANIRWTGQIISFLDGLLGLTTPITSVRSLMVPVMLHLIKIDPIVFFEAIKANNIASTEKPSDTEAYKDTIFDKNQILDGIKKGEAYEEIRSKMAQSEDHTNADVILQAYANVSSEILVAPGIELLSISGLPLGRRLHPQPVTIESQQFIANNEMIVFEPKKVDEVRQYESVCSDECVNLLELLKLDQAAKRLPTSGELPDSSVKEQLLNAKEGNALLKILHGAVVNWTAKSGDISTEKHSFEQLSNLLVGSAFKACNLKQSDETEINAPLLKHHLLNYIHTDMIMSLGTEERLIRPLIDIVAENFTYTQELVALQLSSVAAISLANRVDLYLANSSITKLKIDFTVVHPGEFLATETEQNFTHQQWNLEQLWPEELQSKSQAHLVVLYDDPLLHEMQLESNAFWAKIREVVLDNGFLLVLSRTELFSLERLLYGALFKANLLSDDKLGERIENIVKHATKTGFLIVASKLTNFGQQAILFRVLPEIVPTYATITFKSDETTWLAAVKEKLKQVVEGSEEIVWLLADGQTLPGAVGLFNCLRKEPGGRQFRLLFLSDAASGSALALFNRQREQLIQLNLAVNIFTKDNQNQGTYRHLTVDLLNATRLTTEYQLNVKPNQRISDLASLQLYDSTALHQLTYVPQPGEPLCERRYAIYSSGINFRDVMVSSGRLLPTDDMQTQNCCLGSEFAGRDYETGERVFGFSLHCGTFATSIYVNPTMVRPIPEHWSFDDAVGILTVYFTAWYGLIHKARLQPGATVLIHSAAGGVGLAALHICKAYGCTIYATAGNEEKRAFIAEKFNIPAEHIFSSRDCGFEQQIHRLTNRVGVQYILNSLIGDQVEASLRLLANNGHFIELAKFEMQMNRRIGTFSFLRNLTYHGVAIEHVLISQPYIIEDFFNWLLANCALNQAVQPLCSSVFTIENATAAFRYMTTGKHKGKIVVSIREDDSDSAFGCRAITPSKPLMAQTRTYFDPCKVYILVGGCGGVGLELAYWLVTKGAKRIVLTSRSSTRTKCQSVGLGLLAQAREHFKVFTNEISVYSEDISTEDGVRQMIRNIQAQSQFPIGGIFHLAVSLNDSLLENMTPEMWQGTVNSKATIATHIDTVSRDLCPVLDYFVCFSSVSAGRGNAGQSNYGYANSVLERICERRRVDGLHGLAMQFGPIDDVGLMVESSLTTTGINFASVHMQRIISCLDVLNRALQADAAVISSLVFINRSTESNQAGGNLMQLLWAALGVDPATLPDHATLGEVGMESMVAIEIQSLIESELKIRLTLTEIRQITVGELRGVANSEQFKERRQKMKQLQSYLSSLNLDSDPVKALNSAAEGSPIFLLPSLFGNYDTMKVLASQINVPIINITHEVKDDQVKISTAARYCRSLLQKTYPNVKQYNLVGIDYGALVGLEMIRQGDFNCKLAIIDQKVPFDVTVNREDEKLSHGILADIVLTTLLFGTSAEMMTDSFLNIKERTLAVIEAETTLIGKAKLIAKEIQKLAATVKLEKVEEIIIGALLRAKAMVEYNGEMASNEEELLDQLTKKQGQLMVIRDANVEDMMAKYRSENIFLKKDSPIEIHQVTLNSSLEILNQFFAISAQ